MDNVLVNYEQLHTFAKGFQKDLENHAENQETYTHAVNGRLIVKDGILCYSSLTGTKEIFNNASIVKYLGAYAFSDELIVFTKTTLPLPTQNINTVTIVNIIASGFEITSENNSPITLIDFISNYESLEYELDEYADIENIDDFEQSLSCSNESSITEGDYLNLFSQRPYTPVTLCPILNNQTPINNTDYTDAIWSFVFGADHQIIDTLLYVGNLNFPMNGKITTAGVYENEFYKRIYFSDYLNVSRVLNRRDQKLSSRLPAEFSLVPTGTLLNPRLLEIRNNGSLKAMSVMYMYRLITENGQVTDYSPTSKSLKIVKENNGYEFAGGDTSELTNKSVALFCIVPDYKNFKEIELIAIEFEANLVPTSIRLVGKKPVQYYVEFEHFGSEPEFLTNITLADIFANSISWKYNSDYRTKNNKLAVCALRNNPSYINSKNIAVDFALSGFDVDGNTHSCLLNSDPYLYNYIDAHMDEKFKYVKRKLFKNIRVFGAFNMRLTNIATGEYYELSITENRYSYFDYSQTITDFILDLQSNDANFATNFPNLLVENVTNGFIFKPIDDLIQTDFYNYVISFSTEQVIMDLNNDFQTLTYSWPATVPEKENRLVYGGISNGWFNGNGVRVTMRSYEEEIAQPNTDWHNGTSPLLNINAPTLKKCFMKGEIYRLAIAWYKDGNRLFSTLLGDIKIPDVGQPIRELDDNGNVLVANTIENYTNMIASSINMRTQKIELQFDVRINCELSKEVDAYQIVYVERTEENRTILAQGISQPTERVLQFAQLNDVNTKIPEEVVNKWSLPNTGGPVYDYQGLLNFDADSTNEDMDTFGPEEFPFGYYKGRVTTNRKIVSFDSPDIIYNKISEQYIDSCNIEFLNTLATDHEQHNIIGGYNEETAGARGIHVYRPDGTSYNANGSSEVADFNLVKYSQKIPFSLLANSEDARPLFVNLSVFAKYQKRRIYANRFSNIINPAYVYEIDKSKAVNEGQILSGFQLNDTFQISNNALSLQNQAWFYDRLARYTKSAGFSLWRASNTATGRPTIFIKTTNNLYTDDNISQVAYPILCRNNTGSQPNILGMKANDSHIVFNLKRNNADSVYGGRTDYAYSVNEYIPLSDVMPVLKDQIHSQIFKVEGDTYTHLYLRNKTTFRKSNTPESRSFDYAGDDTPSAFTKYNAWCYAVVLESVVEPRLNHAEEFYRMLSDYNFFYDENFNNAYLQENDLRKSIPVPYNFKDDPNLNNIVAVSEVKLRGDYIDAWTQFKTNEFYELDKDKGSALNFGKDNDDLYVIQEQQTSILFFDERAMISPEAGEAIQIAQGSGSSISGHKQVSKYGTSFRRAVIESDFGFTFFDERKNEFVKINQPLLIQNNLALSYQSFFETNVITDVEGYYDEKYKETNIRFRTSTGQNFVVSYNEALKVFNGEYQYDNDLYMMFQEKVLAPHSNANKLGLLNYGKELEFFGLDKCIEIGVVSAPNYPQTKINKGIAVVLNTNYPVEKVSYLTSLNQNKNIYGNHFKYQILEGVHVVPSKNMTDLEDIRGEWCFIKIIAKSKNNQKLQFFSIVNYVRNSYK